MTRQWFPKKGKKAGARPLFDDAVMLLEERIMLDAAPTVTVDAPTEVQLTNPGKRFDVTLTFDNAGSSVGYGPYIELIVPKNGADGADSGTPNTANDDGLTFNEATYLGQKVTVVGGAPISFVDHDNNAATAAQAINPLTGDVVTGNLGDQLVVLQLPFGSYTGSQTPAEILASFTLSPHADLDKPIAIQARAGFQYGQDALNNPGSDPRIIQTSFSSDSFTPTLATITKVSDAPSDKEAETATGPNHLRTYTITVDVAEGQTLTNLDVTDLLPDSIVVTNVTSSGGTIIDAPTFNQVVNSSDNALVVRFGSVTGTTSEADATVTITFYVNDVRGGGEPVIDPVTGGTTTTVNDVKLTATWDPLDSRDPITTVTSDISVVDNVIQNQPIVIQKSAEIAVDNGPAGLNSGDVIEYTLDIQVSDYFSIGDISLTDILSDGQRLDTSFAPTIALVQRGVSHGTANMAGVLVGGTAAGEQTSGNEFTGNFSSSFSAATGETTTTINISQALIAAGIDADGVLLGGRVGTDAGGTTIQVKFRAVVQNNFEADGIGAANRAVDQGDSIGNEVELFASIRSNSDASAVLDGFAYRDDGDVSMEIARGTLTKSIYAINGNTNLDAFKVDGVLQLKAGDRITYRLTYDLPITSFQNLSFTDFLPLPVLEARDMTFNAGAPTFAAGEYTYGPDDSFHLLDGATTPTDSFSDSGNSIRFDYGDYAVQNQSSPNQSTKIDLLFTVQAEDTDFADGLFLTNLATSSESNTTGDATSTNSIVQIQLAQPELLIQKAYVSASSGSISAGSVAGLTFLAPGALSGGRGYTLDTTLTDMRLGTTETAAAANLDSNVTGLDAGDTARVALVVNNEGNNGAFDVSVTDTLPTGVQFLGGSLATANLVVTLGDGTVLTEGADYTVSSTASGFTINFIDGSTGKIAADNAANGGDIILITYDIQLSDDVVTSPTALSSGASITRYAAIEGGMDQSATDPTDAATIGLLPPTVTKVLVSTSEASTSGGNLTIGETATYQVTYTFPEGTTHSVRLQDILPAGIDTGRYEFVSADIVSIGANLKQGAGGAAVNPGSVVFTDTNGDGLIDTATFGGAGFTVINESDNDNPGNSDQSADQIVLQFVVRAVDHIDNTHGDNGSNTGRLIYNDGADRTVDGTAAIGIALPNLTIDKQLLTGGDIDAGDTVSFTITVSNPNAVTAYDIQLADLVAPSGLLTNFANLVVTGQLTDQSTGIAVDAAGLVTLSAEGVLTISSGYALTQGQTITLTFDADVATSAQAGQLITNTGQVTFSTLAGDQGALDREITRSDPAEVTLAATAIEKTISDTSVGNDTSSTVFIGETVTFDLAVTLSEGATNGFIITDLLPPGLTFVSGYVVSIGGKISGSNLNVGDPAATPGGVPTFSFGNLTTLADNTPQGADDRIVVRIVARVTDAGNANGTILENRAVASSVVDGNTVSREDVQAVTVAVPDLVITKDRVGTGPVDAGDTVTFTIDVRHAAGSTANALDLVLSDTLPAGLANLQITGITTSGGLTLAASDFEVNGTTLTFKAGVNVDLLLGQSFTLTITAVVTDSAVTNSTLTNSASVTYSTLDGADPNERTITESDNASVTTAAIQDLTKTIAGSTDANTGTDQYRGSVVDLGIGETATIELIATLSEGTTNNVVITDQLLLANAQLGMPTNIVITNADGTTYAGTVNVTQVDTNADGIADAVRFDFGTVTLAGDNNAANNFLRIRYDAAVTDVAANQAGDQLTLQATLSSDLGSTTDAVDVDLVAPQLTLDKSVSTVGTPNAGDTVNYTVAITNNGTGPAYDLTLADVLPADLAYTGPVTVTIGATSTTFASPNAVVIPVLLAGQTATITYSAVVGDSAVAGSTLTNTASVSYDSLAGAGGREGAANDSASITTEATQDLTKTIIATNVGSTGSGADRPAVTDLVIGEQATFELVAKLSEGTTNNVVITDRLPFVNSGDVSSGGTLEFVGTPTVMIGGATVTLDPSQIVYTDTNGDGINDTVTFNLGNVTLEGDNDATNNEVRIRYDVRASDLPVNVAGDQLNSPATLTSDLGTLGAAVDVDLVQPQLTIDKSVNVTTAKAGDVVTYTIVVNNPAGASVPAQDVWLTDLLAGGQLALISGSVTTSQGTVVTGNGIGDNSVAVDIGTMTGPVTITFQAQLLAEVAPGSTVGGEATVTYDGIEGTVDGQDGRDATATDGATLGTVGLDKAITATSLGDTGDAQFRPAVSDLAVGEVATFTLTVTVPAGSSNFSLSDLLGDASGQLELVGTPTITPGAGVTIGTTTFSQPDLNGDGVPDLNWTFAGVNATAASTITIVYTARVADVAPNAAGDQLGLPATLDYGSGTISDGENVDIVAPQLAIDKSVVTDGTPNAGDVVTYTVTVTNNGTGPAYDLTVADLLPAGLTYVPGTGSLTIAGSTSAVTNPGLVAIPALQVGETATIAYQVLIGNTVVTGSPLVNTATLTYDSLPGTGGREGAPESDDASFVVEALQDINKSIVTTSDPNTDTDELRPTVSDLNIGETVTFELRISLTEGTTGNVRVTDRLVTPEGILMLVGTPVVTFNPGASFDGPGTVVQVDTDGDGVVDELRFDFGNVVLPGNNDASDNYFTIRYTALVGDRPENQQGDQLDLQATLTTALTPTPSTDSERVDIVAPQLTLDKSVSTVGTPNAGDTVNYTVAITNNGTGPAYDLTLADVLPADLAYTGPVTVTIGATSTTFASPNAVVIPVLLAGQTATITYSAVVGDSAVAGSTLTNTASVSYDSLAGAGGREGAANDSVSFVTEAVQAIDKSIVETSESFTGVGQVRPDIADLTIGERATFELRATFTEGRINSVVITDRLVTPDGTLALVGTPTITVNGVTTTLPGTVVQVDTDNDGIADQLRFEFGDIVVPGDNDPSNNMILIRYVAEVVDRPENQAGDKVTLPVTLSSSIGAATASETTDFVAPELVVSKVLAPVQPQDGVSTVFILTLEHAAGSTAAATNILLSDLIPAGSLLAGAVILNGPEGASVDGANLHLPLLQLGQTVTLQLTTSLDFANPPTGDTINRVTVDYGSSSSGGRAGSAEAEAILPFGNPTTRLPFEREPVAQAGGGVWDRRYVSPLLPREPVYSGAAAPGSLVTLTVTDEHGATTGYGTALVDAGGNWLVHMPSATVDELLQRSDLDDYYGSTRLFTPPAGSLFSDRSLLGYQREIGRIEVGSSPAMGTQTVHINVGANLSSFSATFAPTYRDQFFSPQPGLSIEGVFENLAGRAVEDLYDSLADPEAAGLNRFNREYLSAADL